MFDLIPWKKKHGTEGGLTSRGPADSFENQLARFRDEFNALTERMFGDWSGFGSGLIGSDWSGGIDVECKDNEFVVRAEAPGFDPDDFDIQISGDQLIIRAEHSQEEKSDKGSSVSRRSFHRSITLPRGAESDKIDATYKSGVLELHLPKNKEFKTKRIAIKTK
jgi:HSP20 family protein